MVHDDDDDDVQYRLCQPRISIPSTEARTLLPKQALLCDTRMALIRHLYSATIGGKGAVQERHDSFQLCWDLFCRGIPIQQKC